MKRGDPTLTGEAHWRRGVVHGLAITAMLGVVTWAGWSLGLDFAPVAFSFLVLVVLTAMTSELAVALAAATLASVCLGVVFVEPRLRLNVESAQDRLGLVAFFVATAALAGLVRRNRALVESERGQARELAAARRNEAVYLAEAQRLSQTGSVGWNVATQEIQWSDETYRICEVDPGQRDQMALIMERVHPEDAKAFAAAQRAVIANRGRFDHEFRLVAPSGNVKILRMVGHFLPERPDHFAGALIDITQRRRDEAALRESEFRYRNIFRAMAASFWELDFSGVTDLLRALRKAGVSDFGRHFAQHPEVVREMMRATRVIDVNDQSVRLFGLGDKAALLTSLESFWPEASTGVFADSVVAAVTGAPGFSAETRLRRIDGSEFDALFTASFPTESVASGKLLIGVIDISERVNAEEALRRVQAEFAHASRLSTLGELAASIAHEVNQPLAAMAANADAGLRWLNRPTPDVDEVRPLLQSISADARRASDIIARVRGMAARREAERTPLSINDVVEESSAFLRHELQTQDVGLTLAPGADLPPVLGDRTQLQQVVVNLAINAAQALSGVPAGGRRIEISTWSGPDGVTVAVDDNGPGIHAAHMDRLFESFFSTKDDGLGIGLPICRSIVEGHGGSITAENREGGGARFRFTLPQAVLD